MGGGGGGAVNANELWKSDTAGEVGRGIHTEEREGRKRADVLNNVDPYGEENSGAESERDLLV